MVGQFFLGSYFRPEWFFNIRQSLNKKGFAVQKRIVSCENMRGEDHHAVCWEDEMRMRTACLQSIHDYGGTNRISLFRDANVRLITKPRSVMRTIQEAVPYNVAPL